MTYSTLLPAAVQRTQIAYCQKHASAWFSPLVHTDRHQSRRFRTSGPVNYEWITMHASDGSINRYYDPSTAQFLSIDPLLAKSGQPYAFTADDPLNVTDPLGELGCGSLPFGGGVCHNLVQAAHKAAKWWCTNRPQSTACVQKSSPFVLRLNAVGSLRAGASEADARSALRDAGVKVPSDYESSPADNGKGWVFRPPGSDNDDNSIRAMDQSANPKTYPDGYYRVYNSEGVPTDGNGTPLGDAGIGQPETHFAFPGDDLLGE